MTPSVARRRTAADLRAEEAQLEHAVDVARGRERFLRDEFLADAPAEAAEQLPPLGAEIRRLQARLRELPAEIARAEERDAALRSLRSTHDQLVQAATQQLVDIIAAIEALTTRERLIQAERTAAAANRTRAILAEHDSDAELLPPPFDARREVRRALDDALRRQRLIVPAAVRPDDEPWRQALAILNND